MADNFRVEEDGEQGYSLLSEGCLRYQCVTFDERGRSRGTALVKRRSPNMPRGPLYWTCPKCGGSYGEVA